MMREKDFRILVIVFLSLVLIGCAEINMVLKETSEVLAPQDVVTGKRTLNIEPEDEEIKRATTQTVAILDDFRNNGIDVDIDHFTLSKLQRLMNKITEISHRPQLPWEIHLIESEKVNAFTIGGGKLFVFRGLFGGGWLTLKIIMSWQQSLLMKLPM
jgi:predicted Zn-dependent protease